MNYQQKLKPNERPVLKQDSKGDWTVFLQDSLNGCGYGPLDLDGDFGTQTLAEVNRLQKNLGLKVNGVVDASTWTALDDHQKLFGWQAEWPGSLSLTGIGGTDTLAQVESSTMIQEAQKFMGTAPRFWGRYFQGVPGDGEYIHKQENRPLYDAGIRVLPISRQTDQVDAKYEDGVRLGTSHAKDVLDTFGEDYLALQGGFYFFLDVENQDPSLSKEFYKGWSEAVIQASSKVKVLPCVYLNRSDETTLRNLSAAMKEGAHCLGLWLACYYETCQISPWNRDEVKIDPPVPCKVLLHQYVGNIDPITGKVGDDRTGIYDFSQINPFLDEPNLVIERLISPPA